MSLRPLVLTVLAALMAAGPVFAGDTSAKSKPRRIIVQSAKPAEETGLRPALSAPPPAIVGLPPLIQPGAALAPAGLASGGLAAGGLRSTLPQLGDGGGQCRTRCTEARVICDAQDATPECASRWSICVAACAR